MSQEKITKVVIESPFSGNTSLNIEYLLHCVDDSHRVRKEAPIASHLVYTRFPATHERNKDIREAHTADGEEIERRNHGIQSGFEWNKHADLVAVYTDEGISRGMEYGIAFAKEHSIPIEYRTLGKSWAANKAAFLAMM